MDRTASYWCNTVVADVQVRTGICPQERFVAQPLHIEAAIFIPLAAIGAVDAIDEVVNYDQLFQAIMAEEQREHTDLIERIAVRLVAACFADLRVQRAEVSIAKAHIYAGKAVPSVSLCINREDWSPDLYKNPG